MAQPEVYRCKARSTDGDERTGAADRSGGRARAGRSGGAQRADTEHRDRHARSRGHRDLWRPDRRYSRPLSRPARDRRPRKDCGARLHRHAPAYRKLPGPAFGVRAGRPAARHDHGDLRPARDRQCAGSGRDPLLPGGEREPRHDAARQSQLVRAGHRAGDLGRPAGAGRPAAAARPSRGARAGRGDELSGRAGQGCRPPGEARRIRRWSR